jgi:hypothetical protein
VTLNAPGISVTKLSPNSNVLVEDLTRRTVEQQSLLGSRELNVNDVRLEAGGGTVQSAVKEAGALEDVQINYDIITPDAVAGVRGTVFEVGLSGDGSLVTSVLDGEVALFNPAFEDRGRRLGPGRMARLDRGARVPTSPRPIRETTRQRLNNFQAESARGLAVPPWLGDFQLNGNSFEKNIKIAYDEARELVLSGVAEAQEDRGLSRVLIEGDFGERTVSVEGTVRRDWTIRTTPEPPAEGERKRLTFRVSAEDTGGLRSPDYSLTITLVHSEQRGDRGDAGINLPEGITLSPGLVGEDVLRQSDVRRAIESLGTIREALVRRDRSAYLDKFRNASEIVSGGREWTFDAFQSGVADLFPVLETPTWNVTIEDVSVDDERVRLMTASSYSATMVELLDVSPDELAPDPGDVVRRRAVEQLRTTGTERFVFDRSEGVPRLASARLNLFLDRTTLEEARRQQARWRIKNVLFGLFYAYEQGSVSEVTQRVHNNFLNNDENGFRHGYADFVDSIRLDLENLYDLNFSVRVRSIQFEGSLDRARVEVEWDRRARLGNTNQLWLSSDNNTVLRFRRASPFRLARISGDPLMGLSSPRTGATLVRGGSLDGEANFATQQVSFDGSVDDFDGNEFPELTQEEATEIAGEGCFSGTVESDPTADATWCDDVTVSANVTIPAGVTITVDPATTLTITANETLSVDGTLDIASATISHPSRQKTPGIIYETGSTGTISGSTFEDGDMYLLVNGGSVTAENNTFNTFDTDDTDGGENPVRAYAGSLTFHDNTVKTAVNIGSSTGLELNNNVTVDLQGNTFDGSFSFYLQALGNFSGSLTSSSNDFLGGGNTTWGVVNESSSGGSMSFDNEVFRDLTRGICNICNGGAGEDLTVTNSDFIDNDQPGVAASGSAGTVTMDGNYFGGNNGNNCYTLSENTPDDASTVNSQYEGATSVSNAQNSPNRAPDPGYSSCGV